MARYKNSSWVRKKTNVKDKVLDMVEKREENEWR